MTKVINIIGGPGTGKSTVAAELFAKMKWEGKDVELITEYAKDLVWEQRDYTFKNEVYIFAKQQHRLFRLLNKVEYIITDSPIIMSLYYNTDEKASSFILNEFDKFYNINFFLERTKEYIQKGRNQTEKEADIISHNLLTMLDSYEIPYIKLKAIKNITSETILNDINK